MNRTAIESTGYDIFSINENFTDNFGLFICSMIYILEMVCYLVVQNYLLSFIKPSSLEKKTQNECTSSICLLNLFYSSNKS